MIPYKSAKVRSPDEDQGFFDVVAQIITDADFADDIALLANALTLVESLLHSLEKI